MTHGLAHELAVAIATQQSLSPLVFMDGAKEIAIDQSAVNKHTLLRKQA